LCHSDTVVSILNLNQFCIIALGFIESYSTEVYYRAYTNFALHC